MHEEGFRLAMVRRGASRASAPLQQHQRQPQREERPGELFSTPPPLFIPWVHHLDSKGLDPRLDLAWPYAVFPK